MKKIQTILAIAAFTSTGFAATLEIDFNGSKASPSSFSAPVSGNLEFNASAIDANDLTNGAFTNYTGSSTGDTTVTNGFVNYNSASAPTVGGDFILNGGGLVDVSNPGASLPYLVVTADSQLVSEHGGTVVNLGATSEAYVLTLNGSFEFGHIEDGSATTFGFATGAEIEFGPSTNNESSTPLTLSGDLHIAATPANGGSVVVSSPYAVYIDYPELPATSFTALTCSKIFLHNNIINQDIIAG
ncbi:MAG: hypothetical protein KBD04_00145 [Proteobacteria bacterium]|nr:hypothetical protein [Pseudomonadota bacterium]